MEEGQGGRPSTPQLHDIEGDSRKPGETSEMDGVKTASLRHPRTVGNSQHRISSNLSLASNHPLVQFRNHKKDRDVNSAKKYEVPDTLSDEGGWGVVKGCLGPFL